MKGVTHMRNGFTKGLLLGSVIGASIGWVMDPDMMSNRNRKRMMKNSRRFLRRSGHIVNDIVDVFR